MDRLQAARPVGAPLLRSARKFACVSVRKSACEFVPACPPAPRAAGISVPKAAVFFPKKRLYIPKNVQDSRSRGKKRQNKRPHGRGCGLSTKQVGIRQEQTGVLRAFGFTLFFAAWYTIGAGKRAAARAARPVQSPAEIRRKEKCNVPLKRTNLPLWQG